MNLLFFSGGFPEENITLDKKMLSKINKKRESIQITYIPSCGYNCDQEFSEFIAQYKAFNIKKIIKISIEKELNSLSKKVLRKSDIIFLGGGNTYYFLKQLRSSGALKFIRDWVKSGGLLAGLSAGAILMTKKISTAGVPDFDKDENDENIKNLSSLGLVDFEFFPHYRNSKRYDEQLAKYSTETNSNVYACNDGCGIIYSSGSIEFVGKTVCFYNGQKLNINK